MAFQFGRVGKTLTLLEPETWANSNGTVSVHGRAIISPASDAMRLRDQFLGYQNNLDEPVVPVIVDSEPRLNGYYRVLNVSATTDARMVSSGYVIYDLQLQPVQGFAQPYLECIISGALLTNVVGAVAADAMGFHAVPGAANEYTSPFGLINPVTRTGSDGALSVTTQSGTTGMSGTGRYGLAPTSFYVGAATFEQGSSLQPVVGRMLTQIDPTHWRLSNGLVRVTPNASAGKLDVSHYNGTTWSTVKTYVLSGNGGAPISGFNSLTVLRNSVEETIIRFSLAGMSGPGIATLDLSLRRGDRLVRCFVSTNASQSWKMARDTTEAATAITYAAVTIGGIRATANDGDSNRYVLLHYQDPNGAGQTVSDLVNGSVSSNSTALTDDFAIGSEIGGSGATAPNDAISLAKQYLAAQSESQRVVAR